MNKNLYSCGIKYEVSEVFTSVPYNTTTPLTVDMANLNMKLRYFIKSFKHYLNYSEILTLEKYYLRTGALIEARRYESLVSTVNNSYLINSNFDREYRLLISFIENQLDSYYTSVLLLSEPSIPRTLTPYTQNLNICSVQPFSTGDHNIKPKCSTSSKITSNTRSSKVSRNGSCQNKKCKINFIIPDGATCEMRKWFNSNIAHPYPSEEFIYTISRRYKLTYVQVKKWFSNRRIRSGFTKTLKK